MPFVSLGLVPEFASSLIVPQLMGNVRAAEKLLLGDPFTGAEAVEAASPTRCCRRRSRQPCAPDRRAFQRAAAGRRARDQGADAARPARRSKRSPSRANLREAPAKPRGEGGVQRVLPEAQARLLEVLTFSPGENMSLAEACRCSPLLVAQALSTRRRGLRCPRRPAARRADRPSRATLRVLIAGDSSAAGVGVARQGDASSGYLAHALHRRTARPCVGGSWPAPARPRYTCRRLRESRSPLADLRGRA